MVTCQLAGGLIPVPQWAIPTHLKDDLGSIRQMEAPEFIEIAWQQQSKLFAAFLIRYARILLMPGEEVAIHLSYGDLYTTHRYIKQILHLFKRRADYAHIEKTLPESLIRHIFEEHINTLRPCPFVVDESLFLNNPVESFKELLELDFGLHYLRYLCEQQPKATWVLITLKRGDME